MARDGERAGGVVYVLRSFPELSETFVRREMEGLARAGTPVTVLALERAEGAGVPVTPDSPEVRYLRDRSRAAGATGRSRRGGSLSRWLGATARDVVRLRAHPRRSARCLRLAAFALRARSRLPDGARRLHAHFANDAAALARYLSILSGLPYAVTAHAYDIYRDPFLLGPNLASAARVFTISKANQRLLQARAAAEGWSGEHISVLHCGIDLEAFRYRDPPDPRDPPRLLCIARLVPKKGHAVLLEALAARRAAGQAATLTVAGEGPLSDDLRSRAAALSLGNAVRFLGGVEPDRVLELLRDADLLVLASRVAEDGDRDGLPVALIEAAATGVPVVSTDVSGIPELVTPETGWLVPPERPDQLAGAIGAALTEPRERRVARTRRARRKVEEEFDLRKQVEVLASL